MAAYMGKAPWDPLGYKRVSKKNQAKYWSGHGFSIDAIPMRSVVDETTGKKYKVPVDDYNNYVTFIRDQSDAPKAEKYVATANFDEVQEGCGHIKYLEYSTVRQLLRVTFWDDNIVVYFRVPASVAGELFVYAKTKQEQDTENNGKRHLLGIRFWDLIRIRKTVHGSRYRFRYTNIGAGTAQNTDDVDWVKNKYFFVPTKEGYKPVQLDKLTPAAEDLVIDSIEAAKDYIPFDKAEEKQSIELMYRKIRNLPTKQAYKDKLIKELDSMNGDEAKMRNYLGILGLY